MTAPKPLRKEISVARLRELLALLDPALMVSPNVLGNLSFTRADVFVGYLDFKLEAVRAVAGVDLRRPGAS